MDKKELRAKMKKVRASIENIDEVSLKIKETIMSLDEMKRAETVFCYVSFGTEVHTHELILELLALGKRVCVPKTYDNGIMDAVEITSLSGLSENRFGTLEPIFGKIVEKDFIDIVIIPALCYDKVGYRLGYGKGYYDRYLDGYNGRKIGICPSLCVVSDALPSSHDIKADMIITENGIITF